MVVAILGLLIGLVAPAALRQLGGARVSVAKQSIERLVSVLDLYKLDVGSYPNTDQGLGALVQRPSGVSTWNGPYLRGDANPATHGGGPMCIGRRPAGPARRSTSARAGRMGMRKATN